MFKLNIFRGSESTPLPGNEWYDRNPLSIDFEVQNFAVEIGRDDLYELYVRSFDECIVADDNPEPTTLGDIKDLLHKLLREIPDGLYDVHDDDHSIRFVVKVKNHLTLISAASEVVPMEHLSFGTLHRIAEQLNL